MRVDILERVIHEIRDVGFQRDKFDDLTYRIRWTKEKLKSLINRRINLMCRRKYTRQNITFEHLFKTKIHNKAPLDYILERTFFRPRDVIIFINQCLIEAEGKQEVTQSAVKSAERIYSSKVRDSLISEWASILPSLKILLKKMSFNKVYNVTGEFIDEEFIVDFYIQCEEESIPLTDPLNSLSKKYFDNNSNSNFETFIKNAFSELYRVGAIGLKLQQNERYRFAYKDEPLISPDNISLKTKFQFHSALHIALNITSSKEADLERPLLTQ